MNHHERMEPPEVLDPTEARQASPQRMNFRVLSGSLLLAAIVGAALVTAFWYVTPPAMDRSSGGSQAVAPGTPPELTAPGPEPSAAQPPPSSAATSPPPDTTPPATEKAPGTTPGTSDMPPDAVTAPPAAPGNNPGSGTATP